MKVPFWRCSWVHTPDSTPQFLCTLSDISSIDHLALREFVSGPPRYHLAIKGVRKLLANYLDS